MGIDAGLGLSAPTTLATITRPRLTVPKARPEVVGQITMRRQLALWLATVWDRLGDHLAGTIRKDERDVADAVEAALDDFEWDWSAPDLQQAEVVWPLAAAYEQGEGQAKQEAPTPPEAADHVPTTHPRALGYAVQYGVRSPYAITYAKQRAAEMVGMRLDPAGNLVPNPNALWRLDDSTRATLHDLIVDLLEHGIARRDLKAQIEQLPAFPGLFGESRADTVSRSELAMAVNRGTTDQYDQAGVQNVYVHDNPLCPICAPVAGTVQTVPWAKLHSIGHPNCGRAFSAADGVPEWQPLIEKVDRSGTALYSLVLGGHMPADLLPQVRRVMHPADQDDPH